MDGVGPLRFTTVLIAWPRSTDPEADSLSPHPHNQPMRRLRSRNLGIDIRAKQNIYKEEHLSEGSLSTFGNPYTLNPMVSRNLYALAKPEIRTPVLAKAQNTL